MSVSRGESVAVLPSSKPTILLAALLLRPSEAVSTDFLQRAVWGDDPPPGCRGTLQTYMLRLRRLFIKFGIRETSIETVPGGYRLPVSDETLDLARFRRLVREAARQGTRDGEVALLREALRLWKGGPLSNIASDVLHRDEVPSLVEDYLRATERRFDIELSLGRCRQVLADLSAAARAYPGHERFWEQQIEALYRVGRQADALAEYRTVKRYLNDELGTGPGPALRDLEMAILRGEDLGPAVSGRSHRATLTRRADLPGDLPDFAGRGRDIQLLRDWLTADGGGCRIAVISGPPAIGKTALAVHLASLLRDEFPGGQAFRDVSAAAGEEGWPALTRAPSPPGTGPGTAGALVILDNARSAEHIQPFLPAADGSAVIVTSRLSLAGLATARGALLHRLRPLEPAESTAMLTAILGGPRLESEPDATRELVRLCGGFPGPLRFAAAGLQLRARYALSDAVDWLRADPAARLRMPGEPWRSVADLFGGFLSELDPRLTEAFRALSSGLAREFSLDECCAALQLAREAAVTVLDELMDASLIDDGGRDHYRVPTLLREFARSGALAAPAGTRGPISGAELSGAEQEFPARMRGSHGNSGVRNAFEYPAAHQAGCALQPDLNRSPLSQRGGRLSGQREVSVSAGLSYRSLSGWDSPGQRPVRGVARGAVHDGHRPGELAARTRVRARGGTIGWY